INFVQTLFGPGGSSIVQQEDSAPYPGRRGEWFDVSFVGSSEGGVIWVDVNGAPVFTGAATSGVSGKVGLITHWTPGRFDDVWFCHLCPGSQTERFDNANTGVWFPKNGTWDTEGGVLNNRSAAANDIVYAYKGRSTDYTLSARMLNPYGGPGNRIGMIFGIDFDAGDYYEVI